MKPSRMLAVTASLLVAGCAASGIEVTDDKLKEFEVGETSRADVIASLGQPNLSQHRTSGLDTLTYAYVESQTRPETFIPFVGGFVGGMDMRQKHVTFVFDDSKTLADVRVVSGQMGTGMGFSAGTPTPRTSQPRQAD